MSNIAIFASGSGTNAQNIIEYFRNREDIVFKRIFTNNKNAFVLERAAKLNIPSLVFNRNDFYKTDKITDKLMADQTDLIVLAGFLWLIPKNILNHFANKIINIHPALLPKYGGKGMYGMHVHEAVINSGDSESGISIHYVNEKYDEGKIIFQAKCKIEKKETPDSLASKIHQLEYEYFPKIIDQLVG